MPDPKISVDFTPEEWAKSRKPPPDAQWDRWSPSQRNAYTEAALEVGVRTRSSREYWLLVLAGQSLQGLRVDAEALFDKSDEQVPQLVMRCPTIVRFADSSNVLLETCLKAWGDR